MFTVYVENYGKNYMPGVIGKSVVYKNSVVFWSKIDIKLLKIGKMLVLLKFVDMCMRF